ncbi:MAG: peptidyl-prolyl cis-trans isomerase [Lachnospiraceae bacterium]|nr:peptidyl-prolyl cis-trans isomerase [Lachnospiraceae bacterium]
MRTKKVTALLLTAAMLTGMTVSGCGNKINDTATFATLDDTTITMGVANFCAKYEQAMYDSYYMAIFGENMWESDLYGNGNTMTQDVKDEIEEELQTLYLLQAHMDEYDISVSEEEEAAILKAADDFIAANSKEAVKQIGAENKDNVTELLRLRTIQNKMHNRIIEDADTEVTDEEAAQRSFSYVSVSTSGTTDADGNQVEYTEEEKADLKSAAQEVAKAEDFDAAAEAAGYTVSTASYGSAEDENATMDTAVLEAADALKEGEVSDVIETDSAYYVVRLDSEHDEEATASKKEELISQKQEDYYNDILDGWKEASKWTLNESEWAKVTFEDHFAQPKQEETESNEADAADESVTGTETAEAADDGAAESESVTDTEAE